MLWFPFETRLVHSLRSAAGYRYPGVDPRLDIAGISCHDIQFAATFSCVLICRLARAIVVILGSLGSRGGFARV